VFKVCETIISDHGKHSPATAEKSGEMAFFALFQIAEISLKIRSEVVEFFPNYATFADSGPALFPDHFTTHRRFTNV